MSRISSVCIRFFAVVSIFAAAASAATFTVNKTADTNDGACNEDCSLREAVAAANSSPEADTIVFDASVFAGPQTITFALGEIIVVNSGGLRIIGPGAIKLTLDGNNTSRMISNSAASVLTISGLTFTRGNGVGATNSNSGGALMNNAGTVSVFNSVFTNNVTTGTAGAIRNSGAGSILNVVNCHFFNNTAGSSAGAIQNFATSVLNVSNSSFVGNTSSGATGGGAMQVNGTANISNSTFSGNNSPGGAGGGLSVNGTLININNVTMVGNTATTQGGGLHRGSTNVNFFIRNSIIAGNNGIATSPDVTNSAGGLVSQGNNLIGNVGTSTGWVMSDLQNQNPLVGPLGSNGGLGRTHALLAGSPAIGAGNPCVIDLSCGTNNPATPIVIDQRGLGFDDSVEIGAYTINAETPAFLPNAQPGIPYSYQLTGANTGFTFLTGGTLPPGIDLTTNGAVTSLAGDPTTPGVYFFTIATASASQPAQFVVQPYVISVQTDRNQVGVNVRITYNGGPPRTRFPALLSGLDGTSYPSMTSTFGNLNFENVIPGSLYSIQITSKELGALTGGFIAEGTFTIPDIEIGGQPMRTRTQTKR